MAQYAVYNGSSWSSVSGVAGVVRLQNVSCLSSSFCLATGEGQMVTFNGSTWSSPTGSPFRPQGHLVCERNFLRSDRRSRRSRHVQRELLEQSERDRAEELGPDGRLVSFCLLLRGGLSGPENMGRAYTFDGGSWTASPVIDSAAGLRSVSRASEGFCLALDGSAGALEDHGGSWSERTVLGGGRPASSPARRAPFASCWMRTGAPSSTTARAGARAHPQTLKTSETSPGASEDFCVGVKRPSACAGR